MKGTRNKFELGSRKKKFHCGIQNILFVEKGKDIYRYNVPIENEMNKLLRSQVRDTGKGNQLIFKFNASLHTNASIYSCMRAYEQTFSFSLLQLANKVV